MLSVKFQNDSSRGMDNKSEYCFVLFEVLLDLRVRQISYNAIIPDAVVYGSIKHICFVFSGCIFKTLRLRWDGRHFPDDILEWIFLNENL